MSSDSWLDRMLASIDEMFAQWRDLPEAEHFERKLDALMREWLALPEAERIAHVQRVSANLHAAGVAMAQALPALNAFAVAAVHVADGKIVSAEPEDPALRAHRHPSTPAPPLLIRSQAELDAAYGEGWGIFPRAAEPVTIVQLPPAPGEFCPRCGCAVFECGGAATEGRLCQRPERGT